MISAALRFRTLTSTATDVPEAATTAKKICSEL